MTTTTATTGTGSATSGQTTAPVNPTTTIDENSFLKMLVAQMKYQDPMSPNDNNQFVQEQAQFSTVEALTNLEKTLGSMQTADQMNQAVGLIGANVSYTATDGTVASGVVQSVTNTSGAITLQIGSQNVDPAAVTKVEAASGSTSGGATGA